MPSSIPRIRLLHGELWAEIVLDRRRDAGVVHCLVQQQGSKEILFLQQFPSIEEAETAAKEFMACYKHPAEGAAA